MAAESQAYCDDLRGCLDRHGIEVSELSTHLQGQLVAVHPAYDSLFDGFAAEHVRGKPAERQAWAVEQRSEEHTSELQSLMRISYAVFCLKKKKVTSIKRALNHYQRESE